MINTIVREEAMQNENNTEETIRNGRRKTDGLAMEESVPHSPSGLWRSVRNGVFTAAFVTSLIAIGRFSYKVDSNVGNIAENKESIKDILKQNRELIIAIKEQNIQQKESDKRFEEKFDDANDKLDLINNGVQKNRESIIILQNGKMSALDNTHVNIAMR